MKLSKIRLLDLISNAPRTNKKKYAKLTSNDNGGGGGGDVDPTKIVGVVYTNGYVQVMPFKNVTQLSVLILYNSTSIVKTYNSLNAYNM